MEPDILILNNDEDKRCARCGQLLPRTHFHRNSKTVDGLQAWCIDCKKTYNAKQNIFRKSRRLDLVDYSIRSIVFTSDAASKGRLSDSIKVLTNALNALIKEQEKRKTNNK